MHRLCTLPECVLSGDPYIASKARAVQVLGRPTRSGEGLNIGMVQLLISHRNSSHPINEPLTIDPMLAINEAGMATLVPWTGEDRVVQFWKLIGRVLWNILFVSCPKLRQENFTWAPQSLMAIRESPSLDSWPDALTSTVTEEALHGTFLIYELDSKIYVTETKSHIRVVDSTRRQTIGVAIIRSDFEETKEEVHK